MTRGMGRENDQYQKHSHEYGSVLRRWVPNIPKWESSWEFNFWSILIFWDESANNKLGPFIETPI